MALPVLRIVRLEKKYKHEHSKGEYLVNLFNGELKIKHAYSAPIAPGNSRADHYHEKKKEYITVIRGRVRLTIKDVVTGGKKTMILDSADDEIKRVEIKTRIAHRLENIGDDMAEVIILSTETYNEKNPDVVFCPME